MLTHFKALSHKMAMPFLVVSFLGASTAAQGIPADRAVVAAFAGQKDVARSLMLKRGVWGHYTAMNSQRDGGLSYQEMDQYFTAMHYAFDVNNDGLVHPHEAPRIMLRYSLSGQKFPRTGLSLPVLRQQLAQLFVRVDRNRNGVLSKLELLR